MRYAIQIITGWVMGSKTFREFYGLDDGFGETDFDRAGDLAKSLAASGSSQGLSISIGVNGPGEGNGNIIPGMETYVLYVDQSSGGGDPNSLDLSTLNRDLFGMHYPGGNNPQTYPDANGNRKPDYSTPPVNLSGYPAIGHDRRYDNLRVAGAKGLFTDTRAVGADWKFVSEELSIANLAFTLGDYSTGFKALTLGVGLGLSALPKTILQYSNTTTGHAQFMMWYYISNQGVTNKPGK